MRFIHGAFRRGCRASRRTGAAESERARVTAALAAWDGTDPPLHGERLERALRGLEPDARSKARVAVLAALAPYRIDEAAVQSFKRVRPSDSDLVGAVLWSALSAARRIASWLVPPSLAPERSGISVGGGVPTPAADHG
jgi:hypothetical protein